MTFIEAQLSLQVAAEERVGYLMREQMRKAKAMEDGAAAAVAAAAAAMGGTTDGPR